MQRKWPLVVAFAAFLATLGGHYWFFVAAVPEGPPKCGTRNVLCLVPSVGCAEEPAAAGYWKSGKAFLGLSYSIAAGFFAYVLAHVFAQRGQGGARSMLAGAGFTGVVWLGLCWLVGCCGSPLLPVYVSLLGTRFLGITGPLALGLTVASVAFGTVWFHRARRKGCGCAECPPDGEEAAEAQKTLWEKLGPWLKEARCRSCDCLQGALVQMELDGGERVGALVAEHKVPSEQMHSCLGCDPCPPGEAWTDYVRIQRSDKT